MADIDSSSTDEMVCPHCGYEYEQSYEIAGDRRSGTRACAECGKSFDWASDISVTYTTYKAKEVKHD